jgi:hypothetical protein
VLPPDNRRPVEVKSPLFGVLVVQPELVIDHVVHDRDGTARSVFDLGCGADVFACMLANRGIPRPASIPRRRNVDAMLTKARCRTLRSLFLYGVQ